jgi:ribosomal protein S18 acetylase RimI-like enzyme
MGEPKTTVPEKTAAPASRRHEDEPVVRVRRIHRRDLNRVWEFLKLVFREVNRETVEYQRPRSKKRFLEVYEEEGVEQLLFEVTEGKKAEIVGYAECAFEITGTDNWMNERYFAKHDMRPLFVEELAVHPGYQGRGIGGFLLEQLEHLARVRGCTHLVLEVAENNIHALTFYRARTFYKLDAAIFLAKKVAAEEELLPPRRLKRGRNAPAKVAASAKPARGKRKRATTRPPATPEAPEAPPDAEGEPKPD